MARPIKNNLDYFPHENGMRNDKKIKAVRAKFGHEGYSIYNMLLESISESDMLVIKCDGISIELMAGDFGIDSVKLTEFLEYFLLINLIQRSNGWLYCRQLEKRSNPVFEKRNRFLDDLRRENGINITETQVNVPESTQSKVKESKEEQRKDIIIGGAEKKQLPDLNASVRVLFAKFKELYPKGADGVFQGSDECERWFRDNQNGTTDFKLLVSAVARYRQSDKAVSGFAMRPIKWLAEWKDWAPKVIPGKVQVDEKWIQEEQYDFGECECGGKFVSEHTVTGKTRCPCNRCGKEYRAPPDAVEKAKEILQKQFDRIGAR
jgi:hypothetical protein